ncbi:hypothetical protein C8Q79DRAFT_733472 [Trametes meyenii]|nr:hypothetical protein C8Q79DRAFT_733472 [Trametes meyenii]
MKRPPRWRVAVVRGSNVTGGECDSDEGGKLHGHHGEVYGVLGGSGWMLGDEGCLRGEQRRGAVVTI